MYLLTLFFLLICDKKLKIYKFQAFHDNNPNIIDEWKVDNLIVMKTESTCNL